ncbi:PilI type IV pilus biogenesis protein, partial [Shigella sonnei]|nr:PilI type IV pilus biogenesis protein [Shigella sonnei]
MRCSVDAYNTCEKKVSYIPATEDINIA